jgi:hypothetical protein
MFFENEPTRTLTLIEFLLVLLIGLAPVALTIWMKQVLYRRRVAEDERDSPARADYQSHGAAGSAGVYSDDTVTPFFQVRESRIVRRLPATFDRNKPVGLFVVNPAAEALKSQNGKEEKQSPAFCGNTVGTSEGVLDALAAGRSTEAEIDRILKGVCRQAFSQLDARTGITRRTFSPAAASGIVTNIQH